MPEPVAGAPSRFESFTRVDGNQAAGVILLCDHARNALPAEYGALGLPPGEFKRHIAYDIGAEAVTRGLAARLGASGSRYCEEVLGEQAALDAYDEWVRGLHLAHRR